jgi:hypothetical protein
MFPKLGLATGLERLRHTRALYSASSSLEDESGLHLLFADPVCVSEILRKRQELAAFDWSVSNRVSRLTYFVHCPFARLPNSGRGCKFFLFCFPLAFSVSPSRFVSAAKPIYQTLSGLRKFFRQVFCGKLSACHLSDIFAIS